MPAAPSLSGTITGFVGGEKIGTATTGYAAWDTTATPTSLPGLYPIMGSGLTAIAGNYNFVQFAGNSTAMIVNAQIIIDPPFNPPLLPVPPQVPPSEPGKEPAMQTRAAVEYAPTQPSEAEKEKVMAEQLAREKAKAEEAAKQKAMAKEGHGKANGRGEGSSGGDGKKGESQYQEGGLSVR